MGAEPGRRYLEAPAAKLEPVIFEPSLVRNLCCCSVKGCQFDCLFSWLRAMQHCACNMRLLVCNFQTESLDVHGYSLVIVGVLKVILSWLIEARVVCLKLLYATVL